MDLNINLNISFGSNSEGINIGIDKVLDFVKNLFSNSQPKEETTICPEPAATVIPETVVEENQKENHQEKEKKKVIRNRKSEVGNICKFKNVLSEKDKADLLAAAEMLDEQYDGKTLSYVQFVSRMIKISRVPVLSFTSVARAVKDQFDFSYYHRNMHQNTEEQSHDAAILLQCGLPKSMIRIITEQTLTESNFRYVYSLAEKNATNDEIIGVYRKYQSDLSVFGINDLALKENWRASFDETDKKRRRNRCKWTYDQVNTLVVCYDLATKKGLKGKNAVITAGRDAGITASVATLKKLLVNHKDIPGYETIRTPYLQREREDIRSRPKLNSIMTVKFLFNKRGMGFSEIAKETDLSTSTVKRICDGITYNQVLVDADTERVLEQRYPEKVQR